MVSTLANCTSGMYKAQTTWAHPGEAKETESGDSHGATQGRHKCSQGCRQAREGGKGVEEGSQLKLDVRFEILLVATWLGIKFFVGER